MYRVTVHIWRQNNTTTIGMNNLNHAVFQIQKLMNSATAGSVNLVHTSDTVRNPLPAPAWNPVARQVVPGLPNNMPFSSGTNLATQTTIGGINTILGLPWIRLSKDIQDDPGDVVVRILSGTGDAAANFSEFCTRFDHSIERGFYLALRSLQYSHERAKQGVTQLKSTTLSRAFAPESTIYQTDIDKDKGANELAQKLRNLGFVQT